MWEVFKGFGNVYITILTFSFMKRGGKFRWVIIVLILIVLVAVVYVTFFYYKTCDNYECFRSRQAKCSKASFLSDSPESTWFYRIDGKDSGDCKIFTELRQIKKGKIELTSALEGKNMYCYLPIGVIQAPEGDISRCHGLLKEALQETIIQKLHNYILGNLGNISEELKKAI